MPYKNPETHATPKLVYVQVKAVSVAEAVQPPKAHTWCQILIHIHIPIPLLLLKSFELPLPSMPTECDSDSITMHNFRSI